MRKLMILITTALIMFGLVNAVYAAEVVKLIRAGQTISNIAEAASDTVAVTLSAAYPNNNLKVGQSIVISSTTNYNGTFTISAVTDQSHFSYSQANTSRAAETAGTAGGHYTTLTTWESTEQKDLVTANEIATAECYNDWASGLDDMLTISGWTTDATRYVKIYTPSSERHQGKWGSGFSIVKTAAANSTSLIDIKANYVRVEGLQLQLTNSGGYTGCKAINIDSQVTASDIRLSSNILKGVISAANSEGIGIYGNDVDITAKIYNNVVYDFVNGTTANNEGIKTAAGGTYYIYNNTLHSNYVGIDVSAGTVVTKNNLVKGSGNTNTYVGTFAAGTDYNATDSTDSIGVGTNNRISQIFSFVDEANDDFHLALTDTGAKNYGTDLSADANCPFSTEIDVVTAARLTGLWDIGADQAPTQIYRSVGPAATTALATQSSPTASNAVTISAAGVATWTYALPLKIGVGDVIQYDDGGVATPDQLAFIHARTSSTVYTVRKADGTLPTATTSNSNWAVYRAYISLSNAEAGTENTGIYDTLENFDTWSGGKDLVTANQQWNIACYADAADTTAVGIDGWTTGAKNYLKIYTPVSASESGVSQRHTGVYNTTTAYRLEKTAAANDTNILDIKENYTRVEGAQIVLTNSGSYTGCKAINIDSQDTASDIRIANNILKGVISGASSEGIGIYGNDTDITAKIYNNIIYDFINGAAANNAAITTAAGGAYYLYSNTLRGSYVGTNVSAGTVIAKNNIFSACTTGASGTFAAGTDYNATNNAAIGYTVTGSGNTHDRINQTFTFAGSGDYHLSTSDTGAAGVGADLSADTNISFSDDVDTGSRWAPWSIGADQPAVSVASGVTTGNWNTPATWASGAVPSSTQDVTIAAGKTITFNKDDSGATAQTSRAITVYGALNIGSTTAGANRTMAVEGDIIVKSGGVLTIRADSSTSYATTIKFNCATNAQYGLIVESGGTLDILGTSKYDTDVIITALTQDSSHNGYIYCMDGSKTKIKFAEVSYMGKNGSPKYGILVHAIDCSDASEYSYLEGCKIHNCYRGYEPLSCSGQIIKDNTFYTFTNVAIYGYELSNSVIIGNISYGANSRFIFFTNSNNNIIADNILQSSSDDSCLSIYSINNKMYNNTISHSSVTGVGIAVVDSAVSGTIIKNNIITNNATGISDSGTGTVIDYNLFYGNTANGTTTAGGGTVAITGSNPNFVSTDPANVNYMSTQTVSGSAPALGAGCRLDTGAAQAQTNIGARLGYVVNDQQTAAETKFNSLQLANDNATYTLDAGDTVTTYAVDLVSSTIQGNVTAVGSLYVKFDVAEAVVTANDQHVGQYVYMSSGANKGRYYLIIDSVEDTTDTITIFKDDGVTGINTEDDWTIVDRVYNELAGDSYVLLFNKPGTAALPVTWNTSGTVIVDARNVINKGPGGTAGNSHTNGYAISVSASSAASYNIFDGFIISGGWTAGIGNDYDDSSGIILKNSKLCYNTDAGARYQPDVLDNCEVFNNYNGTRSINGIITSCTAYKNSLSGLYGGNCAIINNKTFGNGTSGSSSAGISLYSASSTYGSVVGNTVFREGYYGIANSWGDYANIINNTTVANTRNGIYSTGETNIVARNNLVALNGTGGSYYGILLPAGTGNASDFNYFYGNGSTGTYNVSGVTEGANSIPATNIAGTDPAFVQIDTGATDANSTTTMIIDAGQSWTVNQWVGYGVKVGTQWAGITSNTANRLHIAPALSGAPSAGTTFYITDFSVTGTTEAANTPLGQGCRADGTAEPGTVNMGGIRDFVKNVTDSKKFNSMQNANDDAGCGAGDTITTYAVDEVSAGTISAATNNGATTTLSITEETISAADQYIGYYLYIYAGTNRGKYYLISDSATASPDTITIYSNYTTGFNAGDKFKIVDRVYTSGRQDYVSAYSGENPGICKFKITKPGIAANAITWNTSGTVIVDATDKDSAIVNQSANYIRVTGFILTKTGGTSSYAANDSLLYDHSRSYNMYDNNLFVQSPNYGLYMYMATNGIYKDNEFLYSFQGAIIQPTIGAALINNKVFSGGTYGINISANPSGRPILLSGNIVGNCDTGVVHGYQEVKTILRNNIFSSNTTYGLYMGYISDKAQLRNNIFNANAGTGIYVESGALYARNNIFSNNATGFSRYYMAGTANDDFDYYYNNATANYSGMTPGSNIIQNTNPNFYSEDTGTADSGSTAAMIIDAGQGWTPNEWVGASVKLMHTTDYWAVIRSNTADKLFLTPALSVTPSVDDAFVITRFYISGTTSAVTPLGQGCRADGTTESTTVNMGAKLGYVVNDDQTADDRKFNSLQAANDDGNLNAGDTVTVYAVNEITTGSISGTPSDQGFYINLDMGSENIIIATGDYMGMYAYMTSGTNSGNYYLITASIEDASSTTDQISVLTDSATGFSAGDTFSIVDRVYDEKSHSSANFNLTKSGAVNEQWITWVDSGTVVLDAENLRAYNIYADTGLNFVRVKDTIKFLNSTNTTLNSPNPLYIGGQLITSYSGNYYMWGDADTPVFTGSLTTTSVGSNSVSLAWSSAASDVNFNHYEIWYGTGLADVQGRTGTAGEWDDTDDANLLTVSTTAATITGLSTGFTYYFKIWAVDSYGNSTSLDHTSAKTNNRPFGGYSADNVIPAAQCVQTADGSGLVTISFRVKDADLNAGTLKTFKYSVDGGVTFNSPANGDSSTALSSGWANNSGSNYASAVDWTGTVHSFTFNTKNADVSGLNGVDQSDVQVQFVVNDSIDDSVAAGTSASFRVDDKDPLFSNWTVNMNAGTITLNFNETIDVSETDVSKIILQDLAAASSGKSYTLTNSTVSAADSTTVTITLSAADLNAIKAIEGLLKAEANSYIRFSAGAVKDLFKNSIAAIADGSAVLVTTYTADTTAATLFNWSLNMHTHQMTLVFNESVDVSTLDVTKITLQNAASPTSSYTLTANSTSASTDGTTIAIDIFNSDFNAIVEKSPALATSAATSYLTMTAGAIKDMSGNNVNAVSAKIVTDGGGTYTANTVSATNFKVTTSAGSTMEAGATKVIIIKAYDSNGCLTPVYGGASGQDKTLVFSGANVSPEGSYTPKAKNKLDEDIAFGSNTVITFTNAQAATTLTLYCKETALISASDTVSSPTVTTASGDRLTITVSQAPFAGGRHLAFSQQPSASGIINVALAQQPIAAIRDVYGNQTDNTYNITLADSTEADYYTDGPGTLSATANPVTASAGQAAFAAVKYDNMNSGNPVYLYAYSSEAGTAFSSGITFATANTTRVDAAAAPVANFNLTPTNDTLAEKFAVLKFKITDTGGDLQPTLVDRIQITVAGTGANASTDIAWAGLYAGATQIGTATGSAITNSLVTFGSAPDAGSDADLVSVSEGTSTEFTVYAYMKNSKLTAAESQTYTFDTDEAKIGTDTGASSRMAADSSAITIVTGTIVITVSHLEIVDQTTGNTSITMNAGSTNELQVRATDANKNVDTGYTGLHSFLFTGLNNVTKDSTTYKPKIENTIMGSGTYISINFASGVSASGGVTLTAYKAETQNLSVSEQNQSYSIFTLSVTVNGLTASGIAKQTGDSQTGAVSKQLPTALTIAVTDTYGNPVVNQDVTFAIIAPANGAVLSNNLTTQVVATNSSGQSATYLTLGTIAGAYSVTVNYSAGTPVLFTETAVTPSSLTAVSGTPQTKAVTLVLDNPFVVKLTGSGNTAIPGETISFSITAPAGASGQSLSSSSGVTDAQGQVSTTLTLGDKIGDYVVRATYSALSADFTATAAASTAYKVTLSGPSSITAGSVSTAWTVSIKDIHNNLVNAGTDSVFSLSSTNSSTGVFYSDSEGSNVITSVSIGAAASSAAFYYKDTSTLVVPTITVARTSGVVLTVSSATAAPTILPTGLSYFKVTGAVTTLTAGTTRTITVTGYDQYGNVKTNLGATNIVFSGANSSPSPSNTAPTCSNSSNADIAFGENTLLSFTNGIATSVMKLYKAESAAIKAASGGITTSDANDLEFIVRHAAADHLKFSANIPTPAGGFAAGAAFPLGALNAVDLNSNLCDGANGGTAYSGSKTVNYTLSGTANSPDGLSTDAYTTTVDWTAGVSTTTLTTTLYRAQTTTITANASDLDGTDAASNSISPASGSISKLTFNTQPSITATTNIVLAQQPAVAVADQYGNPVLSASEQIILSASTTTGSYTAVTNGTLSAASLSVVVSSGLAAFSAVKYSYPENIYLRASANSGGVSDVYSYQVAVSTAADLTTAKITAGLSETVSSIANTAAEKTNVYSFKVTDAGTDGYGAAFKKITINRSASDTTSDWTNYIGGAYLTDGTTQFTGTIEANKIYFGTGNSTIYAISDGQNKTYTLNLYLKSSLPAGADNKVLGFTMDANTDISCDLAASRFAAVDAVEDTAAVTVTATGFKITGTAAMTTGGTNNLTIKAIDANTNIDADYSGYKALIFSGASDSPLSNHPNCTNYGGTAISFGSVTDIEFASGVNSSTVTMSLYKAEIAYIKATQGSITTSSTNHLAVTVSAGSVARLAWSTQPEAKVVASAPWKTFVIGVTDTYGNTTSSTADITVTPAGGTAAAGSTVTVTAVAGLASFSNFAVTCASYPGSVTLNGSGAGISQDTGASNAVTVAQQYAVTVNVKDSLTNAHLTEVTLQILNASGVAVYGPTTANSPFTTNLSYGTYTFGITKPKYVDVFTEQVAGVSADGVDGSYDNNITWDLTMTSLEEATADYHVRSGFIYNQNNDTLDIRIWLERRGSLIVNDSINKLGGVTIEIYGDTANPALATITIAAPAAADTTKGVYYKKIVHITDGAGAFTLTSGQMYYAKCFVNYGGISGTGRTYQSGTTFEVGVASLVRIATDQLEGLSTEIKGEVTGVISSVEAQALLTKAAVVANAVTTQAAIAAGDAATQAKLATAATTIGSQVTTSEGVVTTALSTSVTPHVQSAILNRDSVVKRGNTITLRYRTASGLKPTVSVYDPDNTKVLSAGAMTELGATGVYYRDVQFVSAWGIGDFSVVCSESTKATEDAMTITVVDQDLASVASNTSAILGSTSKITSLSGTITALNSQFTTLENSLNTITKNMSGKMAEVSATIKDMESVYNQLVAVSKQIKDIGATDEVSLEKIYDVSKDKKEDMVYLKNKTEELKAAMDLSQKMIDNVANKPVTQVWFEFN